MAAGRVIPTGQYSYRICTLVEVVSDGFGELVERRLVLLLDVGEREHGCGLFVNYLTESSLALHDAVWHVHLSAESWEPNNNLRRKRKKRGERNTRRDREKNNAVGCETWVWLSSGLKEKVVDASSGLC